LSSLPSIPAAFRATAAARPAQAVLLFADRQLDFAEIDRQSDRCAAGLAARGVAPGDRVALYWINGAEFVIAYLGILKAGAVVVPINLLLNPKEVAYILGDAEARALLYHQAMAGQVTELAALGVLPHLVVGMGASAAGGHLEFDRLLNHPAPAPAIACDVERDLAAIIYTSGTTGRPKGAMLSHANLVANTRSVLAALELRPGEDRLLVVLPMFHSFAATVGMLTPLLHGLALAPLPRFDPTLVSETVAAVRATVFLGVPSMYNLLLRLPDEQVAAWRSIRFGVAGGAAMPVELLRRFEARFGFPVLEGDGPTECSPVTCVNPPRGPRKPASVGLPVPDVEIEILDDAGRRLPTGEIGELCVRGPNVMRGYWRLPEATAENFHGAWLRTGDLGYKDADGYLFMVDRKKDMIIVNGMNVYPRMVEEVLYAHPDIQEAAVVGEPHASHGEIVVAHVVPRPGSGLDEARVKAHCRENLGQHQRPRKVVLREALPKNATGKILKRELRRQGELERGVDAPQD
jgi:long-chain acyl-CoA synthetase